MRPDPRPTSVARLPRRHRLRRGAAMFVACASAMSVVGLGASASPAAAAGTGTTKATLNIRSAPTTSAAVIGSIPNGSQVTLECWVRGQAVNGLWGSTTLWHRARGGYVSDGFIYTGTNGPAAGEPQCGSTGSTPSGLSARVDAFVAKWKGRYADFDGYYGAQCVDLFNFYNRDVIGARRYVVASAYQLFDSYDTAKYTRISASSTPRKGDVAVWASNFPGSGGHGHVAIVLSTSGSTITTLSQRPGATAVKTFSKAYLRGYLRPRA